MDIGLGEKEAKLLVAIEADLKASRSDVATILLSTNKHLPLGHKDPVCTFLDTILEAIGTIEVEPADLSALMTDVSTLTAGMSAMTAVSAGILAIQGNLVPICIATLEGRQG